MSQGVLARAPLACLALGFGYLGWGLGLAWLVFALASRQPFGPASVLAPALSAAVLVAVRALSPAPRPSLVRLLLAPLPLVAIVLVAVVAHAAFSHEAEPPFPLRLATNLLTLAAILVAYRLYRNGFYAHRWLAG